MAVEGGWDQLAFETLLTLDKLNLISLGKDGKGRQVRTAASQALGCRRRA